jgi:hypothetical protein
MPTIARSGKPLTLTFETEAVEILDRLAPSRKTKGLLLSTLLRQEEARRIEARKWRDKIDDVVEVLTAS